MNRSESTSTTSVAFSLRATRFERETLLAEIAGELAGIEPVPEQAEAA